MEPCSSIQGSQPLSRYGDRRLTILPSVLPVAHLHAPCGLHRFEPVAGRDRSRPGQCYLPDKEFRSRCYSMAFHHRSRTFLPASAYRYAGRTVSCPTLIVGFRRTVSEDSRSSFESFLLIICTRSIVTRRISLRVARDAQTFQHTAGFY